MRKSKHVMVNLEPVIHEALSVLVQRESEHQLQSGALSAKVRHLIIAHLLERGLLSKDMLEVG